MFTPGALSVTVDSGRQGAGAPISQFPSAQKDRTLRNSIANSGNISWRLAVGFALFCIASSASMAQRYSFRAYTEGLGNLNITTVAQDGTGYLWVGTQNGLYRYDGSHFQRYGASEGIPDRIIDTIFTGLDGTLWVGTASGIYFERRDGVFSSVQVPVPVNEFSHPTVTTFTAN